MLLEIDIKFEFDVVQLNPSVLNKPAFHPMLTYLQFMCLKKTE